MRFRVCRTNASLFGDIFPKRDGVYEQYNFSREIKAGADVRVRVRKRVVQVPIEQTGVIVVVVVATEIGRRSRLVNPF